jgi:polycomb protein EED
MNARLPLFSHFQHRVPSRFSEHTTRRRHVAKCEEMFDFGLEVVIQEDHKKPVWCLKFCNILPPFSNYFATVGQNLASVYRIGDKDTVEVIQKYVDEDSGENLFTCTWADIGNGKPLLVVAGIRGILKVINAVSFELEIVLRGHGNDIDDLCVHPVDANLVLSASKDESIRLWNIKTATCIAIFAGEGGHRDDVLSIDIHPLGNCFVSGGMDTSVKIWNLMAPELQTAVLKSYSHCSILPFETSHQQFPLFSSTLLHKDYVDAVAWVGNLILSKSTSNRAALWAPDPARYNVKPVFQSS